MVKQMAGIPTMLFVGSGYDRDNVAISPAERDEIRHQILAKSAEIFGGATIVDGQGVWVDDAGKMIQEPTFQIIVYSRRPSDSVRPLLAGFIRFILGVSRQTSVLVDDRANSEAFLVFFDSFGKDGLEHA